MLCKKVGVLIKKYSFEYFNFTYDGKSLGSYRADSEISEYRERDANNEFMLAIRKPLRQSADKLKKLSDEGNNWATFALIALYYVFSMSFSSSFGPKGVTSTIGF